MATSVVHFEIQVDDVERAIKFYTDVFGWRIERYGDMEYWGVYTGRSKDQKGETIGLNGGLMPRLHKGESPVDGAAVNAFVVTMETEDIDAVAKQVEAAGGKVVVPKSPIATMGWTMYCKDTEGNIFGLWQNDTPVA